MEENRLLSFGCDDFYVYGNVVKISTESSHAILSLCEVEVYANAYGTCKSQGNEPFGVFLCQALALNMHFVEMINRVFQGSQINRMTQKDFQNLSKRTS